MTITVIVFFYVLSCSELCAGAKEGRDGGEKYLIKIGWKYKCDCDILKEFRKNNKTRPLSLASENDLLCIMNLQAGSVTPFGILNDTEIKVKIFIEMDFPEPSCLIGVHPNDNTATVWIKTKGLICIIKEHGNSTDVVQI